jgi:predicted PurR-regulated permease PerM
MSDPHRRAASARSNSQPGPQPPAQPDQIGMTSSPSPEAAMAEDRPKRHWSQVGLFVLAILAALAYARGYVLPVILAFLIALTFRPVVRFFARRQIPEFVTAFGLVVAVVAGLAAAFFYLSGPLGALLIDLPRMAMEIERKLTDFRTPVEQIQEATEQIEGLTTTERQNPLGPQEVIIREPGLMSIAVASAPDAAARGLFALVLLLFLLSSGNLFYAKVIRAMPTLEDKKTALRIARNIERELSHYLFTIVLIQRSASAWGSACGPSACPTPRFGERSPRY